MGGGGAVTFHGTENSICNCRCRLCLCKCTQSQPLVGVAKRTNPSTEDFCKDGFSRLAVATLADTSQTSRSEARSTAGADRS